MKQLASLQLRGGAWPEAGQPDCDSSWGVLGVSEPSSSLGHLPGSACRVHEPKDALGPLLATHRAGPRPADWSLVPPMRAIQSPPAAARSPVPRPPSVPFGLAKTPHLHQDRLPRSPTESESGAGQRLRGRMGPRQPADLGYPQPRR